MKNLALHWKILIGMLLGLIFGFMSRVAAAGIALVMLGAVFMVHLPNGFFMNWGGNQAGEGFEYHLLVFGIIIVLLMRGSGAFSVDQRLVKQEHVVM